MNKKIFVTVLVIAALVVLACSNTVIINHDVDADFNLFCEGNTYTVTQGDNLMCADSYKIYAGGPGYDRIELFSSDDSSIGELYVANGPIVIVDTGGTAIEITEQ